MMKGFKLFFLPSVLLLLFISSAHGFKYPTTTITKSSSFLSSKLSPLRRIDENSISLSQIVKGGSFNIKNKLSSSPTSTNEWSPASWRSKKALQMPEYPDKV